jgi:hypothetical protein
VSQPGGHNFAPGRTDYNFPRGPLVDPKTGELGRAWRDVIVRFLRSTVWVEALVRLLTLAQVAPTTRFEEGTVLSIDDYNHQVRWTGTTWRFQVGDVGNGFYRIFAVPPQEMGWQLCDGSTTAYLVVGGATLTTALFTTPVVANQYFRR